MIISEYTIPGLKIKEHVFKMPLDHQNPSAASIEVFGREVVTPKKDKEDLPWIVFFQGGPGFGSPRPVDAGGWLGVILKEYRVFFLDQRGTARSTPVLGQTLDGMTPQDQADYLKFFRQDSIVRDAEMIRKELVGKDKQWSTLGQSFGGWCTMTYLSLFPESIKESLVTGGIPSLVRHVDDIYSETYKFAKLKNAVYHEKYPNDVQLITDIAHFLLENDVRMPNGDRLSARYFQTMGLNFGFQHGFETIHYMIENAFVYGKRGKEISIVFLKQFQNLMAFDTNPIFAILHEAIYAQGFATRWSAYRIGEQYPEFDPSNDKVLFTGEKIFPWMFEEISALHPIKEAANILAEYDGWGKLYDPEKLSKNEVPVACAVYFNDMMVNKQYSQETIDSVPNMKGWYTSEYEHCGLRVGGERVITRLLGMVRNEIY